MNDRDRLRLMELLNASEEGLLSEDDRAELIARLKADEQAQQLYIEYQHLSASMFEYAQERLISAQDAANPLTLLAEMERKAVSEPVVLAEPSELVSGANRKPNQIAWRELPIIAGYVLSQAYGSRPLRWSVAAGFAVAGLLAVLMIFGPGAQPTGEELAGPAPALAPQPAVVATLTDQHNARWGHAAPQLGQPLRSGRRLVLTEGFAEIRTQRGAVAMLEAPCTVELIDSPNALRLHRGKLVGSCLTASSKGFIVKTDQADITDIGTEFGVEVSVGGLTHLQVFRGEVRADAIGQDGRAGSSAAILAGQAVEINASNGLRFVALEPNVFASLRGYWVQGQMRETLSSQVSLVPGDTESNDFMLLVPERKSIRLQQPLEVSFPVRIVKPREQHPTRTLEAGTELDSYVIHFDSVWNPDGTGEIVVRGEVRFDRPILGVILGNEQLHETAELLGSDRVQYPAPDAGVSIDWSGDQITIGPDGKTLWLELTAVESISLGIDQVRVLVQAR